MIQCGSCLYIIESPFAGTTPLARIALSNLCVQATVQAFANIDQERRALDRFEVYQDVLEGVNNPSSRLTAGVGLNSLSATFRCLVNFSDVYTKTFNQCLKELKRLDNPVKIQSYFSVGFQYLLSQTQIAVSSGEFAGSIRSLLVHELEKDVPNLPYLPPGSFEISDENLSRDFPLSDMLCLHFSMFVHDVLFINYSE